MCKSCRNFSNHKKTSRGHNGEVGKDARAPDLAIRCILMAMDITNLLFLAQSLNVNERTQAEATLAQFQDQNLSAFLVSLAFELSDDAKPTETRTLAGLLLKNSLDAKDHARKDHLIKLWTGLDVSFKFQIKSLLLNTLASHMHDPRHTASQVIAKISSIEIPQKAWPDLIGILLVNMNHPDKPLSIKQATLETIGYVCEEISHKDLEQQQVNSIIIALVQGMSATEQSPEVRLAATRALYNALDFAEANLKDEIQGNFIMKVVFETAMAKEAHIREAAYECLVSIVSRYYDFLEPYMPNIVKLTASAVKEYKEGVALQAVEIWSSICDKEIELQQLKVPDDSGDSAPPHFHFIEKALAHLVPMLLETLLQQDEDQDDGVWNLAMAGGTCLGLVARTVGDAVYPLVIPFVEAKISKPNWRSREAATHAFGLILEGPSTDKLLPAVRHGLYFLISAMEDENRHVRDTTAWTLSRIFELLHSPLSGFSIFLPANLQRILKVLLASLKDAPHVSEKVCGAIYYLARGYWDDGKSSSMLTPFLVDIISSLIATAERTDGGDSKLRTAAYETLKEVIRCANLAETSPIIRKLLEDILEKLAKTRELQTWPLDVREKQGDLHASLCGVLRVIIQKLSSADETKPIIIEAADDIMVLLLMVLGCRSSTVQEEAMLTIGAVAYATGTAFEKYMQELYKYLEMGLKNFEEYQVCATTVGLVGDICRALDDKILPYCDGIIILLKDLSSAELHCFVKPPIISCLGDIALAIGEYFGIYIQDVVQMMKRAAELCVVMLDSKDEEIMEYGKQLRHSILEAYSCILQGLGDSSADLMLPHVPHLLQCIELLSDYRLRENSMLRAAVALLGDLADALGPELKISYNDHFVELLGECLQSDDKQLNEAATRTRRLLGLSEKLLGCLGGMFYRTWKPEKTREIVGPLVMRGNSVQRAGNHLEQREKLGLSSGHIEQTNSRTTPSEPSNALQKVESEKLKQDISLSDLSNLLGELKDMAVDMGHNKLLRPIEDDVEELNFRVNGANKCARRLLGK